MGKITISMAIFNSWSDRVHDILPWHLFGVVDIGHVAEAFEMLGGTWEDMAWPVVGCRRWDAWSNNHEFPCCLKNNLAVLVEQHMSAYAVVLDIF